MVITVAVSATSIRPRSAKAIILIVGHPTEIVHEGLHTSRDQVFTATMHLRNLPHLISGSGVKQIVSHLTGLMGSPTRCVSRSPGLRDYPRARVAGDVQRHGVNLHWCIWRGAAVILASVANPADPGSSDSEKKPRQVARALYGPRGDEGGSCPLK